MKIWICLLLVGTAGARAGDFERLAGSKLRQMRQQERCLWVHPWASWCAQCVTELPALVPRFAGWKKGKVLVLDMGGALAQETFTQKWNLFLDSPLTVYLKPPREKAQAFRRAVADDWDGALPFNVLYSRGRELGRWSGPTPFETIEERAALKCPAPSG